MTGPGPADKVTPVHAWYHDPLLVLVSLAAVAAFLGIARFLRSWSADARRKCLHVAVGSWVLFVTPRFDHLAWALVPPVLFIAVNASRFLRRSFPDLVSDPGAARGLWTFPLGIALACAEHGEHDGEAEGEHGLVAAEYGSDSVIAPSHLAQELQTH